MDEKVSRQNLQENNCIGVLFSRAKDSDPRDMLGKIGAGVCNS